MVREELLEWQAKAVATALREAGENRPAPVSSRGGDARAMRGVPISAVGVPGTLPGTDPEREACR